MFATTKQPAYLLYPCDRGWRIMKYVWENSFSRTASSANVWYDYGRDFKAKSEGSDNIVPKYWWLCMAGGAYLAGLSQFVSAFLFVVVFVVTHLAVLTALFMASMVMIAVLAAFTKVYSLWFRAHYRCPGCHESMPVPVFVCPSCSTDHSRLWPSMYGVFHHSCSTCQTKLPTMDWKGRRALERKCPHCNRPLNTEIGTMTNIHVPVVGGPSTGKSNFIVMATHELIQACRSSGHAQITFPDAVDEREFQASLGRMQGGRELLKTPNIVPQAYNLAIKRTRDMVGKIVYFYDAAGEAYSNEASAMQQAYYKYVHGLIFVIDPFALPSVRDQLQSSLEDVWTSLRPSSIGVMEAYERTLTVLEASVGLKRGKRFAHPVAVVVTKVDAFGLEDRIGSAAARALLAREPQLGTEAAAIDRLTREFLETYGLDNFVREIQLQFQTVRFFSTSALGRMPNAADMRPFAPARVSEPLAWVLDELGVINAGQLAQGHAYSEPATARSGATG